MLQTSKTRRNIVYLWKRATRHYPGGEDSGRATDQQSVHHVRPANSQFNMEQDSKRSTSCTHCRITKTQDSERLLGFREKHKCGTIVERHLEDVQYQMRMHEQGYTQSDMEEFDRIANEKGNYAASSTERACHRDQFTRQRHRKDQRTP